MIHWTPEGWAIKSGLNLYATWGKGRPWLRIVWCSYGPFDTEETRDNNPHRYITYLRIRTRHWPCVIFERFVENVVSAVLTSSTMTVLTLEQRDDVLLAARQLIEQGISQGKAIDKIIRTGAKGFEPTSFPPPRDSRWLQGDDGPWIAPRKPKQ